MRGRRGGREIRNWPQWYSESHTRSFGLYFPVTDGERREDEKKRGKTLGNKESVSGKMRNKEKKTHFWWREKRGKKGTERAVLRCGNVVYELF